MVILSTTLSFPRTNVILSHQCYSVQAETEIQHNNVIPPQKIAIPAQAGIHLRHSKRSGAKKSILSINPSTGFIYLPAHRL